MRRILESETYMPNILKYKHRWRSSFGATTTLSLLSRQVPVEIAE